MAIADPDKLELLKNHSKRAFDRSNPETWNKIQGEPKKIKQVREIEDRMQAIRERMVDHIKKHTQNWVAKEVVKIFIEREHLTLEHPMPDWAVNENTQVSCLQEARSRVKVRIQTRLNRIPEIGKRMQSSLINNQEHFSQSQDLKSEVQSIVSRTQAIRAKARKHFIGHKKQWIDKAQQKGYQSPEIDVFKKQRDRLDRIDKAEHRLIHKAFNDHGKSFIQNQQQNLSQEFDQAVG